MATQSPHEHSAESNPSNTLTLYDPQSFEAIMTDTPPIATSTVVVTNPSAWLIEFHDLINQAYDAASKLARSVPAEHRQSAEIAEQYHHMRETYITVQYMMKRRAEVNRALVVHFKKDMSDASRAFFQQAWKVIAKYTAEEDARQQAIDRLVDLTKLPHLPNLQQGDLNDPDDSDAESSPSATRPLGTPSASTSPHVNQDQTSLIEALIKVISRPSTVNPVLLNKPPSYDGKDLSKFRSWWTKVKDYIAAYRAYFPDDQIKIKWVGSLLADKGQDWHQKRARSVENMGTDDNWSSYTAAIQRRFKDPAERHRNYKKMQELRYKGDTAQYLTEMEGLNDVVKWSSSTAMEPGSGLLQ